MFDVAPCHGATGSFCLYEASCYYCHFITCLSNMVDCIKYDKSSLSLFTVDMSTLNIVDTNKRYDRHLTIYLSMIFEWHPNTKQPLENLLLLLTRQPMGNWHVVKHVLNDWFKLFLTRQITEAELTCWLSRLFSTQICRHMQETHSLQSCILHLISELNWIWHPWQVKYQGAVRPQHGENKIKLQFILYCSLWFIQPGYNPLRKWHFTGSRGL